MAKNIGTRQRVPFIDVVRGILILLVIVGHTQFAYGEYIYWFHMPAFFILSGSLAQPHELRDLWSYLKKTFLALGKPYLINFFLIGMVSLLIGILHVNQIGDFIHSFFLGGSYLTSVYGVYWFVTAFAISRLIFTLTETLLPKYLRYPLYLGMYLLAHHLSNIIPPPGVTLSDPWWAPRYFLLGVPYLALGALLSRPIHHFALISWRALTALALYLGLIYLDLTKVISFRFDWKYGVHANPLLDLLVPCLGFYLVLSLARLLERTRLKSVLVTLGQHTMEIMYWHLIILIRLGI